MADIGREMHRRDFGLLDWLSVLLGVWLIVSSIVFRYTTIAAAVSTEIALGVLVISLALYVSLRHVLVGTTAPHMGLSGDMVAAWLQIPIGVLIILAPFLLGYSGEIGVAIINNILVGAFVILIGLIVAVTHQMAEPPPRAV